MKDNSVSSNGFPGRFAGAMSVGTNFTPSPPPLATETVPRLSPRQRLLAALAGLLPRNLPASNPPSGRTNSSFSYKGASRALGVAALLAVLAASLLFLLPGGPAWAQDNEAIEYPENGTGAVATFTADDPEGKSVEWSMVTTVPNVGGIVEGDFENSALFEISKAGELTFMSKPDFEDPQGGGTANGSNTYMLVVAASDGAQTGYKKVEVEVTNVDEDATISIELSSLQPQISTAITVDYVDGVGNPLVNASGVKNIAIMDPDRDKGAPASMIIPIADVKWQWSKSSSRTGTYADITGDDDAETIAYIPASQDRGMYLRVTATYEDGEGEGKTVVATSMYPVRAFPSGNSIPAFPTDFGPDPDVADATLTAPMAEADDGATEGDNVGDPVEANDANNDRLTYSLEADDTADGTPAHADLFQIDRMTGQVTVGLGKTVHPVSDTGEMAIEGVVVVSDEDGFMVTIKATDPSGESDMVVMTITVDEVDEAPVFTAGETSHSHAENTTMVYNFGAYDPENDTVTYSLSGDDAGKLTINADNGALTFDVSPDFEARGSEDGDNVYEVTVKAALTDDADGATEKRTTVDVTVEVTNVDELGTVTLSASQPRIGIEIRADTPVDPDGGVTGVTWQWSIADNAEFNLNDADIKDATNAGYTPVADDDIKFLRVTASYTDAEGSGKTAVGTPTNLAGTAQAVVKVRNLAPVFNDEDPADDAPGIQVVDRSVVENAAAEVAVGDLVVATDEADADTSDNLKIFYLLSGADAASFDIDSDMGQGQIKVGANAMLDYETKPAYEVTVTARDPEGLSSSVDVTINVTDVDEAPEISGSSSEMYPENGTGAVATYTADDPEMKSVTWSIPAASDLGNDADLTAADNTEGTLFSIDASSGVLTFKDAPDYETPRGGTNNSNTHMLVVAASDGAVTAYKKVEVEVTDEEEAAATGIEMSSLQPQVSTEITILYTDGVGNPFVDSDGNANDGIVDPDRNKADTDTDIPADDVEWQWSKSSRQTGRYTDITGDDVAKVITYTPASQDRGMYLRVTATYEDGEGEGKTVVATSAYPVRAFLSGNSVPAFPTDFDPDPVDVQATPKAEADDGAMAGDNVGDPVEANDMNNDRLTYSLEADDTDDGTPAHADLFQIDRMTGQVTVGLGQKVNPASDSADEVPTLGKGDSFTVTIKATDPSSKSATVVMTITVNEVDEAPVFIAGETSHSHAENTAQDTAVYTFEAYDPESASGNVAYSLSGDDDGKFTINDSNGELTFDASPDFEARGSEDGDNVYEVTVKAVSTDIAVGATEKSTTVDVTVEVTNENEPGTVTLSASQPRVGIEIRANTPVDPDGGVTGVTWQWSIADNAEFNLNDADIKDATNAGYTPVAADDTKFLRVTATYTDAQGSGKTAVGMPNQAGMAQMVVRVRNLAPVFTDEDTSDDAPGIQVNDRSVVENAAAEVAVGDLVVATDIADDEETDDENILYLLSGADAASFTISSAKGSEGQIQVGAGAMLDHETKDTYMVTVTARDPEGLSSSVDVTIKVTDVDEAPEIMRAPDANVVPEFASATTSRTVAENTVAGKDIDNPVAASDANRDALTYALSGTDAASFDIDTGSGQLMTLAALDYETKATYSVTVTASDSGGLSDSIDVTITVTNVEEAGTVTLSSMTPMVGTELTATLSDPDDSVTGETWQWSKSDVVGGTFADIAGAMSSSYTPVEGDASMYLRATVSYTDGEGSGKSEIATSANVVTAADTRDPLLAEYDPNADDVIEKADMRRAVGNFFGSEPTLSRAEMRRLVGIYFS